MLQKITTVCLAGLLALSSCNTPTESPVKETKEVVSTAYEPNWESLAKHKKDPEWFADAKLGIYFHWGVYSVPAYKTEWYPNKMYTDPDFVKYHTEKYGKPSEFNYHDFIPMFKGEQFDPEDWAELFKKAGAKFGGPVAQHHDGFAMWDSKVNPWNAAEMGPKRDVMGEFFASLRKRDIKTIATFHHARNRQRYADTPEMWGGYNSHFAYHPDFATSSKDPKLAKLYGNLSEEEFHKYWLDQVNEVVEKYSPDILWYDSWLNIIPEDYLQKMSADYFNAAKKNNQEVLIAYKQYDLPSNVGVLDIEQGGKKDLSQDVWLTDITVSNKGAWCYTAGQKYKSPSMVVKNMIDVWSKNGVVLLNISPKANGEINQEQRDLLAGIGEWLDIYGEAVYGTRPFKIYGFGSTVAEAGKFGGQSAKVQYTENDIRFTMSKDKKNLYVFVLGQPKAGKKIELKKLNFADYGLPFPVKRVVELSSNKEIKWLEHEHGFTLTVPNMPLNGIANVFKMEME